MNLFELFVKIGVDDQASGKISDLSSKLGSGLATAAKIGTAAVTAASAGITALTTTAVNNYAEYEQLVGGVETLFKQSADVVQQYAANAYKTAGMSANEYMDTVTSFSASLLQSLDGDTAAAAEKANLAITDMSDNANKMGTSMEMIQNAYNGFAKQNYTMLDNLKLGYGGTKDEMQRLMDKANELNAQQGIITDYQIDSYADIVDAIHVVQTEMGITGTTALEAGRTISGSIGAMKSAWANLLTGLADGNADIEKLVDDLVTTVVGDGTESNLGVLGNVIPAVETALNGASVLISKALPEIMEIIPTIINDNLPILAEAAISIIQSLMDGISQNQGMLFGTIFGVITYFSESFITMLPQVVELGLNLIASLANGIAESLPELIPTIVDVVIQIVETMIENVDMLIDAAIAIIIALADGLINSLPELIEEIPGLVMKIVNAIIENAPKLLDAAAEIIANLTSGLIEGFVGIASKVGGWLYDNIVQPIVDKVSDFKDAGKQLLEGLWNGIEDKVEWLKGKVSGVVDTIKGWFTSEEGFDEHSPSKWAKKVFQYVMEGGGEGLEAGLPGLMQSVGSVTDRVKSGLDFGTASVDFAYSGLGMSSAGIINSTAPNIYSNSNFPSSIELRLSSSDGQTLGRWLVPFVRSENRSNPEVVSDI